MRGRRASAIRTAHDFAEQPDVTGLKPPHRASRDRGGTASMPTSGASTLGVNRYRYLLASLLLLIVVEPWLRGSAGRVLLVGGFSAILISAVWGLHTSRRGFMAAMTLALAALAGNWASVFVESLPLLFVTRGVVAAFLGLVVWTLLGDIARQTRIQPETIYQAACVYLILGVVFALFYASVSQIDSGAFSPVVAAGAAPDPADASTRGAGVGEVGLLQLHHPDDGRLRRHHTDRADGAQSRDPRGAPRAVLRCGVGGASGGAAPDPAVGRLGGRETAA